MFEINKKWLYEFATLFLVAAFASTLIYPYILGFPSVLIEDDGFFYAEIAKRIALEGSSSFDGINQTSGYHLLWMGVLASVGKLVSVFSSDDHVILFSYFFCSVLISIAYSKLFFTSMIERIAVFILACFCSFLMETGLLVLLLLLVIKFISDLDKLTDNRKMLLYLAVFLIPLTRIDAVIILLPIVLYFFYKKSEIAKSFVLLLALGMLTHFTIMYFTFGELFSVSSKLKAGDSEIRIINNFFEKGVGYTFRNALAVGLLFISLLFAYRQKNGLLISVIIGISGFYFAHLTFNAQRNWYFLPVLVPAFFCFSNYLLTNEFKNKYYLAVGTVSLFLVSSYGITYQLKYKNDRINSQVFVNQVNQILQPNDVVYQVDGSGYTGYFINNSLINGDGLVNSYAYANKLVNGDIDLTYLEQNKVTHVITNKTIKKGFLIYYRGIEIPFDNTSLLLEVPLPANYRYTDFKLYRLNYPN